MKKNHSCFSGALGTLMLSVLISHVQAQNHTLSGTVTYAGKPLGGVTVAAENSSQLTTTASDGTWRLQLPAETTTLLFRHPRFGERREEIDGRAVINLALDDKETSIEEVVLNAGYYKVRGRESTGSIAKVSAKDIENQPVTNVLSAVQGRMAGVSITQNSGTPGGGYDIQIRGRNSLRNALNSLTDGNQPLYVIDGVPLAGQNTSVFSTGALPLQNISPLNNISPNDIESIEVLKDADATAIYGSRGGNGVVLITTKKGKASPVLVTLNSNYSLSKVARRLQMMNTEQYLTMRTQAFANVGVTAYPANAYDINGVWDQARSIDWQKELIGGTSENTGAQISVSGGTNRNSFSFTAAHQEQSNIFPGEQNYKSDALSNHYNYQSDDRSFSVAMSGIFTLTQNNTVNMDLTGRALSLSPDAPPLYDNNGNINWQNKTFNNPLGQLESRYTNHTQFINQNLVATLRFLKNFQFRLNTGFTLQRLEEYSLSPNTMYTPASILSTSSAYSSSSRGTSDVFSWVAEPQLTWAQSKGPHFWEALLGATVQGQNAQTTAMSGYGYTSNALIENIAAANTVTLTPETYIPYRYLALFGRLNYRLHNRYIINVTGRRDGSSRFGPDYRFADFGAIGAAWLISEESFLKNNSWLSFAKLRGSFGLTGSDAIGDYQYSNTYSIAEAMYDGISALYPEKLFNPAFSWEKTNKLEAALDLAFFHNRLSLSAAWYRNRSSNQLVGIPLPSVTGFSSVLGNLNATVQNSGLETELQLTPLKAGDVRWTLSFNASFPRNKLISFPGLEGSTYANQYEIGQSVYAVKVLNYEGIDRNTGQYTFTDYNQDGKISLPDDAKMMRTLGPKMHGGFENTLVYKNVQLSVLFHFVQQEAWNYIRTMATPGSMINQPEAFTNVWSPENTQGIIMPYTPGTHAPTNTLTALYKNSTAAVSDASFIRLKNIRLNYTLPLKNAPVREANVYFQGQNLWTWTKFFGLDPEYVISGFLPPLKTMSLGMQLTF